MEMNFIASMLITIISGLIISIAYLSYCYEEIIKQFLKRIIHWKYYKKLEREKILNNNPWWQAKEFGGWK